MSVHYSTDDSPRSFRIDDEGVCEPLWGIGSLEWSEVREVFSKSDGGRDYICIVVRDRDALKSRLGFLRRFFSTATRSSGFGDLSIDAVLRGVQAEQIVEFASNMVTASSKKKAHPVGTDNDRAAPGRV
jgi:hypothetical protein